VKGLLEQLPAETQRVVTMRYDQELTYREIAAEVGTNSTAVFRQVLAVRAQVARLGTSGPMAA
jgi:DNA-directed RNA polymerase specialized sigma24 family protein